MPIFKAVTEVLRARNFINVASCDRNGRPNSVSKLIVRQEGNTLVLVDYTIGRTYTNLKENPRVCLSFFDVENLRGYQIIGPVEIVEHGTEYDLMARELTDKEIRLASERIIRGMTRGKPHGEYEMGKTHKFVFFKVLMEEIVEIGYSGEVKRDKASA